MALIGPVLDRLEADHANLRSAFLRLLELDRMPDAADLAGPPGFPDFSLSLNMTHAWVCRIAACRPLRRAP